MGAKLITPKLDLSGSDDSPFVIISIIIVLIIIGGIAYFNKNKIKERFNKHNDFASEEDHNEFATNDEVE